MDIYSYEVMDRTISDDTVMAYQCPTMAYAADNGGVAGFQYETFEDIKNIVNERNRILTHPFE